MAVPHETIWDAPAHTLAKHKILERYLNGWMPIITSKFKSLIYFDGFSGPGIYKNGEPGSPIVALNVAQKIPDKHQRSLFLFGDEREDRISILQKQIDSLSLPKGVSVVARAIKFEDAAVKLIKYKEKHRETLPTFALIDPFGFSGIPYDLIKLLMEQRSSECLITFMVDSLNRWLEHPEDGIQEHVTAAFGTEKAAEIVRSSGANRIQVLRDLYLKQLKKFAKYCRYFEMRDQKNRVLYYLFFISNNLLGFVKMKEAMWGVDTSGGFRFSDSTDPSQEVLFDSEDIWLPISILQITNQFESRMNIPVKQVRVYIEKETIFLKKHMKKALREMEETERIKPHLLKQDGSPRKIRTFPDGAIIDFI